MSCGRKYSFVLVFRPHHRNFAPMISKNQIKWVHSLELKKNRRREGLFVAEGPKVVGDLLRAGFKARQIFATTMMTADTQLVTNEELQRISFLQHPQEVLAVLEIPANTAPIAPEGHLSLALDGVQDPGNVGTIIRIADWFGIDCIYCSPDTADIYNPKVVQATMGSIAHLPIVYTYLPQFLDSLPETFPVYGTLLDGNNIYDQSLTSEGIIVMGNEGNGISEAIRQRITRRILIPNFHQGSERAESLNVAIATAITCSEFRRRQ